MSFIDVLFWILMVALVLEVRDNKSGQCMNRDTSSALKGFAMLVIMLHHVHNEVGYNSFTIAVLGFLMTSFYFFMSGYGNTKSLMYRKIGGE